MRAPTPEQKQRVADLLETNNVERFEARRRQAQRTLGAESKSRVATRNSTQGSGARQVSPAPGHLPPVRASVDRLTPLPGLAIAVIVSLGVLFVLAVAGAYSLIHEVFG